MNPSVHLMAKPCGPACNLDCHYCFYLEKASLFPGPTVMSDEVLEAYIRTYIQGVAAPEVSFVWQGGEPLLAGIDFYRRALALQARYAGGKTITNAIQTNGLLLDETWCAFLKEGASPWASAWMVPRKSMTPTAGTGRGRAPSSGSWRPWTW